MAIGLDIIQVWSVLRGSMNPRRAPEKLILTEEVEFISKLKEMKNKLAQEFNDASVRCVEPNYRLMWN